MEPFHVLYGGAQFARPGLLDKMKRLILGALERFEPSRADLRARIASRIETCAIQDLRIDFEDGFGIRPDQEEDEIAKRASTFCTDAGNLPPCWGIRTKAFSAKAQPRALRTLEVFCQSATPPVVTLPKIQAASEVAELRTWLDARRLPTRIELMVETAAAVRDLPALIDAAGGRCHALHFGAYDFLSELGVPGPDQNLRHPFCDQARYAMQLAAAGTGIRVVDGVTNVLPLDPEPQRGWDLHIANVRHSLAQGCSASWDVHPAQVAARYVAVFTYYDEHQAALAARLRQFLDDEAQATRVGAAFDDAASIRGLARFFLRGLDCGALEPAEVPVSREQLQAHL